MNFVIASNNHKKVEELERILKPLNVRAKTASELGVELDDARNDVAGEERLVSSDSSKVKVYVVPTNEEVMIARDTAAIVSGK